MTTGNLLAGRYAPRRRALAQGSMVLYEAEDRARAEMVLLVEIPRAGIPEDAREDLQAEVRAAMDSRHPTSLTAHGVHGTHDKLLLSFEYPAGTNAAAPPRSSTRRGLSWPAVRRTASDLIDQAIAVRDRGAPRIVSQKQMWIERSGAVRVLPFWPLAVAGTDKAARSGRTDRHLQHGIAITLYRQITGQPPSGRVTRVDRVHRGVPRTAGQAIDRALRTEASRRFKSLGAFDRALGPRTDRPRRRVYRVWLVALILAGCAAGIGLAWPRIGPCLSDWARSAFSDPSARQAANEAPQGAPVVKQAVAADWAGTYVAGDAQESGRLTLHPNGRFVLSDDSLSEEPLRGAWQRAADMILLRCRGNEGVTEYRGFRRDGVLSIQVGDTARTYQLERVAGRTRRVLEVVQPRDGWRGRDAMIRFAGRVAAPGATVLIAGQQAEVDKQGWFSQAIEVDGSGAQAVEVQCRTRTGFIVSGNRTVHLDRAPPRLEVSATGRRQSGRWIITVAGRARDVAGGVRVTVDGRDVVLDKDGWFQLEHEADAQQSYVHEVVAVDDVGNRTQDVVRSPVVAGNRITAALVRRAEYAAQDGDWASVERLIVEARRHGVAREDIPAWLLTGVQNRSAGLAIRIESPLGGDVVDGPRVQIRGRVLGWKLNDVVRVKDKELILETPAYSTTLDLDRFGKHTFLVELLRDGEVRADASLEITVRDRNPEARAWTRGYMTPAQEACAERYGIPVAFENHVGMRFILIPPGAFEMGPDGIGPATVGRKPNVRRVVITKPFYVSLHEVTNAQIREFPQLAKHFPDRSGGHSLSERDQPAVGLVHPEIQSFITWLSRGDPTPGRTYKLPTEAQWEYAARAGSTHKWFPWEDGTQQAHKYANLSDTSTRKVFDRNTQGEGWERSFPGNDRYPVTAAVGQFLPNAWGLYDTIGNAAELCRDHPEPYEESSRILRDPVGRLETGIRALRGGSWIHRRGGAGLAWRGSVSDIHRRDFVGFRLIVPVNK